MKTDDQQVLKAIIVYDEDLARKGLAMRLEEFNNVELVQEACNADEALNLITIHEPDLVFLDIQMPGMTGLEMLSEIQADVLPMIVFVTAYDTFAVEAFKVHAVDYLLKPVEKDRLAEAISRASHQRQGRVVSQEKEKLLDLAVSLTGKSHDAISELIGNSEKASYSERLAIKDGSSTTFVPIRDIDWIDAAGDYMCVHVKNETHIMRTTMRELEAALNPVIFQRVHRSTIVNLERITKVSSHINGEYYLTLKCGSRLKISRSYKEKVKHFF